MKRSPPFCLFLSVAFFAFWQFAFTPAHEEKAAPSPRDLERNRQLLQKWQADPEHNARLQRDLRDFWAMPRDQREHLRQLDEQLHALDAKTRDRLWKVAERYRAWLERLPEEERRKIEAASDPKARLRIIEEIRERQWIERSPGKVREQLEKLPPDERTKQVKHLREQERRQRKAWERPLGPGQRLGRSKTQLVDLPAEVQTFWRKNVWPRLTPEEKVEFAQVRGRLAFVPTLKRLAERHPVLPPHGQPIKRYDDLPNESKKIAGAKPQWERRTETWEKLRKVEGIWPEWALAFHGELTAFQRKAMRPLGASRPKEFSHEVREFMENTLRKKASAGEWKKLHEVEGKWPEYPKRLLELAHKHNLAIPGMSLPSLVETGSGSR